MRRPHIALGSVAALAACLLAAIPSHAQDAANGPIVVPSISFSDQGGGQIKKVAPARPPEALAGGYVHFWYTPGHWLEWTIENPAAGEYQASLHYATKYRVVRGLKLNGEPAKGLESFALEPTGRWTDWKDAALPAPIALKGGRNVLRLICLDDASAQLSEIRLTSAGREPIVLKATRFTAQGGGAVQALTPPTGGYTRDWQAKGHWLEWTIDAPAAGPYDIYLHYAAEDHCPRELQVNGEVVKGLASFALLPTGDDMKWTEAKLGASVPLKAGKNVLRMTSLGGETEVSLSSIRMVPAAVKGDAGAGVAAAAPPVPAADTQPSPRQSFVPVAFPLDSLGPALPSGEGAAPLKVGQELRLGDLRAKVLTYDVLPFVRNEYSSRFVYELFENPQLAQIRQMYRLDDVIAPGKGEFQKQLLLQEWVFNQWDFGHARERYDLRDPFEILLYAKREHKFQCMHSAAVFQTLANSLGWVCRQMAIPSHTFNEVWSNEYRRWVMFDATSNYCPERAGAPLSTFELRQALCYEDGNGVVSLRHKDGEFTRTPKDPKYGARLHFVAYIPNTNNLVSGPDYAKMFIVKDKLCEGEKWHARDCPKDPAAEAYFPVNQAGLSLSPQGKGFQVTIGTMTPNFKEFQVRVDGGEWKTSGAAFAWVLRKGANKLEARSLNKFGVAGPVSTIELEAGETR